MHSSGFFRIKLIARLILKREISRSHTISDQSLLLSTIVLTDDLDLADVDSSDDHPSDAVDILIGSDCYWDAVICDVARGKDGPVVAKSKFEWLLSEPVRSMLAVHVEQECLMPENSDIQLVDDLH